MMSISAVSDDEMTGLSVPEGPRLVSMTMEQAVPEKTPAAIIRVIGIGGGGANLTNNMIDKGIADVEFFAVNTDVQDLFQKSRAPGKIPIGKKLTGGRGAGGDPVTGEKAANEDRDTILGWLKGVDMVFITATFGGGTGTGAAPVIAKLAKEEGALTVGIVTLPFEFEGPYKMELADAGINKLRESIDTLIVIPNENVFEFDKNIKAREAYLKANDILYCGVKGISDIITRTDFVNTDFADVAETMRNKGDALFGIGIAEGQNRGLHAATQAVNNPFFAGTTITGATSILVNIAASEDLGMMEVKEVVEAIRKGADPRVKLIHGLSIDPLLEEKIQVTVIATGFAREDNQGREKGNLHLVREEREEQDIYNTEEWDQIFNKGRGGGFLGPRNIPDDLDVPTIIRDKKQEMDKNRNFDFGGSGRSGTEQGPK
ncbi:MAG: cell division protein FtsZ [Treponema sp.]|jgi:cell division protein FtsZ|nr:cell division protein FtsZ [Treponema sp.]